MQIFKIPHVIFESTSQFSFKIFSAKHSSSVLFFTSKYIIYFGQRSQLKSKFFRFSSARVKIRQIPHVSFEMTSQFLSKFCIALHCHDT